jgi:galactonate dehydratase
MCTLGPVEIEAFDTWAVDFGFYNAIYVRVQAAGGAEGYGEIAMRRRTRTLLALLDELGESLLGCDATRIELHAERLYRDAFLGGTLLTIAISAFDMALWDLNARALGVPAHRLLGGAFRDAVPVYTHVAAGDGPAQYAEAVRERVDAGFTAIKTTLPIFYRRVTSVRHDDAPLVGPHVTETELLPAGAIRRSAEFMAEARSAVGPDVRLMVDVHGRLNVSNALALCEALAPYDPLFVEEPVPPERSDWLAAVASRSPVPIASGERWGNHLMAAPFIEESGVAVVQPDVGICGGITPARKIAAIAEVHAISVAFHNPFGPLQSAATWHLAATLPNLLISESMLTPSQEPVWGRYVDNAPIVQDGIWQLSESPGFGPVPDVEALAAHPARYELDRGGTR